MGLVCRYYCYKNKNNLRESIEINKTNCVALIDEMMGVLKGSIKSANVLLLVLDGNQVGSQGWYSPIIIISIFLLSWYENSKN